MDERSWHDKYIQLQLEAEELRDTAREVEEDLQNELQQAQEEIESLHAKLDRAESQRDKLHTELADVKLKASQANERSSRSILSLQSQISGFEASVETLKTKVRALEQDKDELERSHRMLQAELETQAEALEAAVEDRVMLRTEFEELEDEHNKLQAEFSRLAEEFATYKADSERIQEVHDGVEVNVVEAHDPTIQIEVMNTTQESVQDNLKPVITTGGPDSPTTVIRIDPPNKGDELQSLKQELAAARAEIKRLMEEPRRISVSKSTIYKDTRPPNISISMDNLGDDEVGTRAPNWARMSTTVQVPMSPAHILEKIARAKEAQSLNSRPSRLLQPKDPVAQQKRLSAIVLPMIPSIPLQGGLYGIPQVGHGTYIKGGFLEKHGNRFGIWKHQYFILNADPQDPILETYLYANSKSGETAQRLGGVFLNGATVTSPNHVMDGRNFIISIRPAHSRKVLYLSAVSEEERSDWLQHLRAHTGLAQESKTKRPMTREEFLKKRAKRLEAQTTTAEGPLPRVETPEDHEQEKEPEPERQPLPQISVEHGPEVLKAGALWRRQGDGLEWEVLYFVLKRDAHQLDYFAVNGGKLGDEKGHIPLISSTCGTVSGAIIASYPSEGSHHFLFAITPPFVRKTHVLEAETDTSQKEWIEALSFAVDSKVKRDAYSTKEGYLKIIKGTETFQKYFILGSGALKSYGKGSDVCEQTYSLAELVTENPAADPPFTMTQRVTDESDVTDTITLQASSESEFKEWIEALQGEYKRFHADRTRAGTRLLQPRGTISMSISQSPSMKFSTMPTAIVKRGLLNLRKEGIMGSASWKKLLFQMVGASRTLEYFEWKEVASRKISLKPKELSTRFRRTITDSETSSNSRIGAYFEDEFSRVGDEENDGSRSSSTSMWNVLKKQDTFLTIGNINLTIAARVGGIPIGNSSVMKLDPAEYDGKPYLIGIVPAHSKRIYVLQAEDEQAQEEWIEALRSKIAKNVHNDSRLEGYLAKKSSANDKWQERYFVLRKDVLQYFKRKTDKRASGLIALSQKSEIRVEKSESNKIYSAFSIQSAPHQRRYYLRAKGVLELENWLANIRAVIQDLGEDHAISRNKGSDEEEEESKLHGSESNDSLHVPGGISRSQSRTQLPAPEIGELVASPGATSRSISVGLVQKKTSFFDSLARRATTTTGATTTQVDPESSPRATAAAMIASGTAPASPTNSSTRNSGSSGGSGSGSGSSSTGTGTGTGAAAATTSQRVPRLSGNELAGFVRSPRASNSTATGTRGPATPTAGGAGGGAAEAAGAGNPVVNTASAAAAASTPAAQSPRPSGTARGWFNR